uniref:Uncharacterized protein n=1 Tax=Cyanoptyche gloeocystis TaxID=77922 RepID=A0A7S2JN51_9EUKA
MSSRYTNYELELRSKSTQDLYDDSSSPFPQSSPQAPLAILAANWSDGADPLPEDSPHSTSRLGPVPFPLPVGTSSFLSIDAAYEGKGPSRSLSHDYSTDSVTALPAATVTAKDPVRCWSFGSCFSFACCQ